MRKHCKTCRCNPRYGGRRSAGAALDRENPRYTRRTGRTGRVPLTLINGSTAASIEEDLQIFAAAIHFSRPCMRAITRSMPVLMAPVALTTPRNPPMTRTKSETSMAFAMPEAWL